MGWLYIFRMVPYLIGQVEEHWLRHVARQWARREATVTEQTLGTTSLEIRYLFEVNGESHEGMLQRRYLSKSMVDSEPVYESGAKIEVLVDPKNPDRSYFPLPLGSWGLLFAVPLCAVIALGVYRVSSNGASTRNIESPISMEARSILALIRDLVSG